MGIGLLQMVRGPVHEELPIHLEIAVVRQE